MHVICVIYLCIIHRHALYSIYDMSIYDKNETEVIYIYVIHLCTIHRQVLYSRTCKEVSEEETPTN